MNVFELIKEKLEERGNIQFQSYTKPLITVKDAISIVDEVEKEFEEKYLIVPKDDFTEHLLNMGYTKGIKDGYNKAIDEFAEALKTKYGCLGYIDEITFKEVDEIAEQLKGGSDK